MSSASTITKDSPETLAFRAFGQEHDHLVTVRICEEAHNFEDARGYQETADLCLDLGWETLERAGWRHCDIARFRHHAHLRWAEQFPLQNA